jgi:hypothetical protein
MSGGADRWIRWNLPQGWVISGRLAHPALVSEADFIAAQDVSAPRGPAGLAARWYLLAGLLRCGICSRRRESAWSNHRPAYRCRHGYTSGTRPDSARPKNTYVREGQILPHLVALAILHTDQGQAAARTGIARVTAPERTAELIDHLRAAGVTLIYDPAKRTLRTDTDDSAAVTIGQNR